MDGIKSLFLVSLIFLLANCDQKQAGSSGSFVKSGNPGCEEQQIPGEYLVYWKNGQVSIENFKNDEDFKNDFLEKHENEIVMAEPHYRIDVAPNVEFTQRDWGGQVNWGVSAVEAESAWGKSGTEEVIVAVIDSGMDINHPELQGVLAINDGEIANGEDDDGNGLVDDINGFDFVQWSPEVVDYTGHGTHIAGIIAAQHNEGSILGAAPDVKILPLNFISSNGGGSVNGAINAIRYARDRQAKVINASWGGDSCSFALRDEIKSLAAANILFVTAAGNSGNDLAVFPEYPAAFVIDNQITVGASTFDGYTAAFSNFGNFVDLVAPGANILSTYPPEFDFDGELDGIASLNGTSMAAPFVSAAAAILWANKPEATYVEIKQALLESVDQGPFPVSTRGHLNIRRALDLLFE